MLGLPPPPPEEPPEAPPDEPPDEPEEPPLGDGGVGDGMELED